MHNFNFEKFKHYNANKHLMKHKSQTFNFRKKEKKEKKEIATCNTKKKNFQGF
jgi:hypothetical protein